MPLDPQTQAVLEMMAAMSAPPVHAQSVEEARQAMAMMAVMAGEPEPVGKVEDRDIAGPEGTIPSTHRLEVLGMGRVCFQLLAQVRDMDIDDVLVIIGIPPHALQQ